MPTKKDYSFITFEAPERAITVDADALKEVRLKGQFRLPQSYCRFAAELGYGLFGKLIIIYIPMKGEFSLVERSEVLSNVIRDSIEDDLFEYGPDGSPELALRLIPFGVSENGHIFGWDPEYKTSSRENAIYAIGSKCLAIRKGGSDLFAFTRMCIDERVRPVLGSGYKSLPAVFRPLKV